MELHGRAIAPGIACGPVVRNRPDLPPEEAAGAILVAERAVPEDVPRILACAGTITGAALPLSHVGLLCLEYGKPSVALAVLDDVLLPGTLVVLDGTRGTVTVPEAQKAFRRLHDALGAFARAPDALHAARVAAAAGAAPAAPLEPMIGALVRSAAGLERLLAAIPSIDPGAAARLRERLAPRRFPAMTVRAKTTDRLVIPLEPGIGRDEAGGKAAALAEAMPVLPASCRVPAGFVVTSAAYRLHLEGPTAGRLADAVAETSDHAVSRRARAAILGGGVRSEIREAIEDAARELGSSRLAVRSSATIEDGPFGSLAGLFDSSLGVSAASLVDRVRATWASLWNARAIAALRAAGTSPATASQAVLVQEAVATRSAGILATGDPVVVNAAWGLGEGVAQGEIAGDQFTLRAGTGDLLSSELGHASSWIVLDPDRPGTVERPLPDELRGRPSLSAGELETLAALARTLPGRIVEFGFDPSGTLVVFQVRRGVRRQGD